MSDKREICEGCSEYADECICDNVTLRDKFAIAALSVVAEFAEHPFGEAEIAKRAYMIADAMIAERDK